MIPNIKAVSYTHLDVYKRQQMDRHILDENQIIEYPCGLVQRVRRRIMPHRIFVLDAGERDRVSDRDRNMPRTSRYTNEEERAKDCLLYTSRCV